MILLFVSSCFVISVVCGFVDFGFVFENDRFSCSARLFFSFFLLFVKLAMEKLDFDWSTMGVVWGGTGVESGGGGGALLLLPGGFTAAAGGVGVLVGDLLGDSDSDEVACLI